MPTIKLDAALTVQRPATDSSAPKWNKLVPVGTFHRGDFPGGRLVIDSAFVEAMVANWQSEGRPERPINYFHRGASDEPGAIHEKIAAGWIKDLQARPDGLYALIAWTKRAREHIVADELRYLSPELALQARNKRTGDAMPGALLLGAGLLLDPYFTELPRVAAAEGAAQPAARPSGAIMDKAQLCALLGLPADTPDDQVWAKLKERLAPSQQPAQPATTAASHEQAMKFAALEQTMVKLNEQVNALSAENATLKTERRKAEVVAFCDDLVKAGKLTPAIRGDIERIGLASGVEAIQFMANAPAVVPMSEVGVTGSTTPKAQEDEALQKFNDRIAELQGKGMKFTEAHATAQREMPQAFERAFRFTQAKREEA